MTVFQVLLVVAGAGALGGLVAALLSEDRGFVLPHRVSDAAATTFRPGVLGLIVIGAISAALSWGLYGPLADANLFGGEQLSNAEPAKYGITVAAVAGAVLVGAGGSKWLSSQVDKTLLQQAARDAKNGQADPAKAEQMVGAQPSVILQLAK